VLAVRAGMPVASVAIFVLKYTIISQFCCWSFSTLIE